MDSRNCRRCGSGLQAGVRLSGLCPRCLLDLGLRPCSEGSLRNQDSRPGLKPPASRSLRAGQYLGPYQIIRELGRGGMGVVYEAEHAESGRVVALKILGYRLTSARDRSRFLREGRLAASVSHPHTTYVYGTEELDGLQVIVMELTPGGTLKGRVEQDGPLAPGDAVDAILQVIEGLEAASVKGILHRDVKPSNCFLDSEGAVKVGDFGLSIAPSGRGDPSLTTTDAIVGTPSFASPEQLRGEKLDIRSDIYSLGATLYFLLTGTTPFQGNNDVQLLTKILEGKPESPEKLASDIPRGLSGVVMKCLRKVRSRRFVNYRALRNALLPFSSRQARAAGLGIRYVAGAVDFVILFSAWLMASSLLPQLWAGSQEASLFLGFILMLFYFALPESWLGTSAGKVLCRLRVIGAQTEGANGPG